MLYFFGITDSIQRGSSPVYDADAAAFFARVTAAGGTLTTTEKDSVNTLVLSLKASNIWTEMGALYPMVGGTAASCAQNLASSSYTGTFSGGWTFSSAGAAPNGTNGYMNTSLTPSTYATFASYGISVYINQMNTGSVHIGSDQGGSQQQYLAVGSDGNSYMMLPSFLASGNGVQLGANCKGFMTLVLESTSGTTGKNLYYNSVNKLRTGNFGFLTTIQSWLGCNTFNGGQQFSSSRYAMAIWHKGLNSTQSINLYNSVQSFQVSLSREVYDNDAQAFFDRVTTAGGTLTTTEKSAVNTLVLSLKSNNIWDLMGAVYPMVGGTAASCAQNLISSSYTGTFSGGWTYSSAGVTPNGTNGYMNTGLTPSTYTTNGNFGIHVYINQINSGGTHIASDNGGSSQFYLRTDLTTKKGYLMMMQFQNVNNDTNLTLGTNMQGFTTVTVESTSGSNGKNAYFNGVSVLRNGNFGNTPSGVTWLGANTYLGGIQWANSRYALAAWTKGLVSANAISFYNSVQTFQTTLGRNV